MSGLANVIQCQPVAANASNRCVLNIQVYSFCYEASLIETIAIFCADLRSCNRVYFTQQLYSRISNARSELSMIKEPMFLSGVRTYGTGQRTPMKWFLEYIELLFHTSPTQKSGTLRTFSGDSFSHFLPQTFFTELEQKYGTWLETTYQLTHVSVQKSKLSEMSIRDLPRLVSNSERPSLLIAFHNIS